MRLDQLETAGREAALAAEGGGGSAIFLQTMTPPPPDPRQGRADRAAGRVPGDVGAGGAETGVDPAQFKSVLGHFASGVAVITGIGDDGPAGFTCQSLFALSLDPPLIAIAPSRSSTSWPKIADAGRFCANVLCHDQEHLARSFAISREGKFAGVAWESGPNGAPRLAGALAWIDCTIEQVHAAGDHYLVVGRVTDLEAGSGHPLLFYRAAFETFGRVREARTA